MEDMMNWIKAEGDGHYFFVAIPVCFVILFILMKGRRLKFLIPSLAISLIIINPIFFNIWSKLGLYAYWRILWVIPVIPTVASIIPSVTEKMENNGIKAIILIFGSILIVFSGTFVYSSDRGIFIEAENNAKLPNYVVKIANRLLELDKHPRVICQDPIGVYIRQYSGNIDTLYGRDIGNYYIYGPSDTAKQVHEIISNQKENLQTISQIMQDDEYDYLVMIDSDCNMDDFELVDHIAGYGIYRAIGKPQVIKKRNESGQILSITTVDKDGQPYNNIEGYATVYYNYDSNGFIVYEFYTDKEGIGVADEKGIAGYEREYNRHGEMIMERTLGVDGNPITAYQNFAEIRREYTNGKIVKESYFDSKGSPVKQLAGHAAVKQEWSNRKLVSRTYLDSQDIPINRIDKYSRINYSGDDIAFFDIDGNKINYEGVNLFSEIRVDNDGWSDWMTPVTGTTNYSFGIGVVNLGKKTKGDSYCCQVEIEFKDVSSVEGQAFLFQTQGSVDGGWEIKNIWYPNVVCLNVAPDDGVYSFNSQVTLDEDQAKASLFSIGFRCDNWNSGSFRFRHIKIEKGEEKTEWSPGI